MDAPEDQEANLLKEKGNNAFHDKKWDEAIDFFTQAINIKPNEVFFSNRAAALINLQQYPKALEDANAAIALKPDWPRGYQRRGTALYFLKRFEESVEAYKKAVELEPTNTTTKTSLLLSEKAIKLPEISSGGCLVQFPIIFNKDSPNDILWEVIDLLVDWYINNDAAALWIGSPASEISHLSNEELYQLTKRVLDKCIPRNFPVVVSPKPQSTQEEYVTQIKKLWALGPRSILISLSAAVPQSEYYENTLFKLIKELDEIPLGIYESPLPYERHFSPNILKTVAALSTVWYYVDTSVGSSSINAKMQALGRDFKYSFHSYATQGTQLSNSLQQGFNGYAGVGSSFVPKLYRM